MDNQNRANAFKGGVLIACLLVTGILLAVTMGGLWWLIPTGSATMYALMM